MKYHLLFLSVQCLMGWMRSISQTPTMQDGQLAIPAIDGVHRLLGRDTLVSRRHNDPRSFPHTGSNMHRLLGFSTLLPLLDLGEWS